MIKTIIQGTGILLILLASACKEDIVPGSTNDLVFYCPDETSEFFIEGTMGDERFCYYDGVDGYKTEFTTSVSIMTEGPDLTIGGNLSDSVNYVTWKNWGLRPEAVFNGSAVGTIPDKKHWVTLQSPRFTVDTNLAVVIKDHIRAGALLLQSDVVGRSEGFNITFRYNDLDNHITEIFETYGGDQTDSFLRIDEVTVTPVSSEIERYEVQFSFSGNLYYRGQARRFYRRLSDARLRISFDLEVDQ